VRCSFFLAETAKYLYLLWTAALDAPLPLIPNGEYIFTTEGHLLPIIEAHSESGSASGQRQRQPGGEGEERAVEEACGVLCAGQGGKGPMELGLAGGSGGGTELMARRCVACRATGGRAPAVRRQLALE
jgi:hypothetical protein